MFDDLDKTLELLLRHGLPPLLLENLSISFISPDGEFPPAAVTLPAINLFLYDIRENHDLRDGEWPIERQSDGSMLRRRPTVRVDCSYIITVWPSDAAPNPAADEHKVLGEIVKVLVSYPVIPEPLLQGSLAGQDPPLPALTLHQSQLQSWGDFWQAIGAKPKAALNYTVTIGVVADRQVETEKPVLEKVLQFATEVKR